MEEIAISKFKATCLAVLAKVKKTGQPVLVTRFGQPIARIEPPEPAKRTIRLGTGVGSMTILGIYRWTDQRHFRLGSRTRS